MAHPCFSCGGDCYCNGDIDDVIVSKTPRNCEGCGCDDWLNESDDDEDEFLDDEDDYDEKKLIPKDGGLHDPNTNITHYP